MRRSGQGERLSTSVLAVLARKRHGLSLADEEINFFVRESVAGRIPDYQISAFLMAVAIHGMNSREMQTLTLAMRDSGRRLDFSRVPGAKVDKHSTGGVGDGTSLVLGPLVACFGLRIPMMPGRGLGHTGGTLDKWEAIPDFQINPPEEKWAEILREAGCLMISPRWDLAPADAKFYSLRDVTATVDSLPLITSSILSKKLSEGAEALVFDVKVGSGAFLREPRQAEQLANCLIQGSRRAGCKAVAVLSDMEQPLGQAVGNALEIKQAIQVLKGGGPRDFVELTLELAYWMLFLGGIHDKRSRLLQKIEGKLQNGEALARFALLVKAQGGNPRIVDDTDSGLPKAKEHADFVSSVSGYVIGLDARTVGWAASELGAGRKTAEERIDPGAGVFLHKKRGDRVRRGELLATVHAADGKRLKKGLSLIQEAYQFGSRPSLRSPLIKGVIK